MTKINHEKLKYDKNYIIANTAKINHDKTYMKTMTKLNKN